MNPSKIDIFIAYAREDKAFLEELRKQLRILRRNGTVNKIWYDGEIIAGQMWEAEIKQELENADIFLLLLSPDFINSDYAYDIEMTKALERHRNGEATLIPIIARACAWHLTPLSELQAPVEGKPLGNLTPLQRDPLYSRIIDAVAKAAEQKRAEKEQTRRYFDDKKAWEKAVQLNTLKSYDNYLAQHPNGAHLSQAKSAIASMKAQQKAERERIERQAWNTAQNQEDYEAYLKNYPNGQYAADARKGIAERKKQQAQAAKTADIKAFQAAKAQNNIAAYQQYLKDFPDGIYRKAAWKGIQRLEDGEDMLGLPWKKIGMGVTALLFLGVALWGSGVFGDKGGGSDLMENKETPIDTLVEERNTELEQKEEKPITDNGGEELKEETSVLSLDYRFGKNLIIAKWEGGVAPYTIQLSKGSTEKYGKSLRSNLLEIPITAAYRANAGDYTLTISDKTGQTVEKSVPIGAPKDLKPSKTKPSKTSFKAPAMVFVKGGTFTMGCQDGRDKDCYDREKPAHSVSVQTFSIGKYEVTNEEFCAFLNEEGNQKEEGATWLEIENEFCSIERNGTKFQPRSGLVRHPVVRISWYGAVAYCRWLSKKTGKNYRLPTEAEWEYAARGGNNSQNYLYSGSNNLEEVAWYSKNSGSKTHSVGSKKANELGIYNMSGNVSEWCADHWHSNYNDAPRDGSAWDGSSSTRVLRGGSGDFNARVCRSSSRGSNFSLPRNSLVGFRLVRS